MLGTNAASSNVARPCAPPDRGISCGRAEAGGPDRGEETLQNILQEIRRRTVWQCLAIYLGGSWLALQIVDLLTDNMGLPDWVFPFALVLLVLGLPVVLATAIVQERLPGQAPEAARTDRAPEPGEYAPRVVVRHRGPASVQGGGGADERTSASATPPPIEATRVAGAPGKRQRLFTWRNAIGGGVLAALLLTVVTTGFMFMRSNGIGPAGTLVAKGVIDERSPILVSEFESSDADADLARAMTEAFRIDFSQTNVVKLVEPTRVADALGRMELEPTTPLTLDVARRVARREGIPAVIGGTFARVPGGFVLTGRIEEPDGTVLASHRETAADSSEVLPAIDALSEKLRERLGESFTSLRADVPLERVTTSSLRALELYTEAIRTIEYEADDEAGIRLLEEALEEDPEFASAWRKLGVSLRNTRASSWTPIVEAMTRAYELRERLTPRERYLAEAAYYEWVAFDRDRAIAAYERMLDLDPRDPWALNNVASLYGDQGQPERQGDYLERAVREDSSAISLGNLAIAYLEAERIDDADSAVAAMRRMYPLEQRGPWLDALVALHREDLDAAEQIAREAVDQADGSARMLALWSMHSLMKTRGRLREAAEYADRAVREAETLGSPTPAYDRLWPAFWTHLITREDTTAARRALESALAAQPLEELDPLDRPYLGLAGLWAAIGEGDRARGMIAAFREALPEMPPARYEDNVASVEAELALAAGRWDEALEGYAEFLRLDPGCDDCFEWAMAEAHDRAGRPDEALVHYENEIDKRGPDRLRTRSTTLGPALERIAEIHDEQGRLDQAAAYYARFADLWSEADPELQPRVEAARARVEEIVRARG